MEDSFKKIDKECLVTFGVVAVILIIFYWYVYPAMKSPEAFADIPDIKSMPIKDYPLDSVRKSVGPPNVAQALTESQFELKEKEVPIVPPYYDPETGSVMDGTNFKYPTTQKAWRDLDYQDLANTEYPPWQDIYTKGQNQYLLDDGGNGNLGLQYNMCSPSCCSEQWPTSHKLPYDPMVCKNKQDFMPSNIMCNNSWQSSGCACLSKKQFANLSNRGGNS